MPSFVRSVVQGETLGDSIGAIMRDLVVEYESAGARSLKSLHKAPDQDPLPAGLPDLPGDVRRPAVSVGKHVHAGAGG
jgi:hypothetical protein